MTRADLIRTTTKALTMHSPVVMHGQDEDENSESTVNTKSFTRPLIATRIFKEQENGTD